MNATIFSWIIVFVLLALLFCLRIFMSKGKREYMYQKKQSVMTPPENELYSLLETAYGFSYAVFAQMRLSTLVEHKIVGQQWTGALWHIDKKSVDFVLCDKNTREPLVVIELDDSSHLAPRRQQRDRDVASILSSAHLPLVRITQREALSIEEIKNQIAQALAK